MLDRHPHLPAGWLAKALSATLVAVAVVSPGFARVGQTPDGLQTTPVAEKSDLQGVAEPSDNHLIRTMAEPGSAMTFTLDEIQAAIVAWLSANFDLPAAFIHPRVEFVQSIEMATLRYKGLLPAGTRESMALAEQPIHAERLRAVVAVYNDRNKTIYLPSGWRGRTPVELSILVHEMVHHLQNESGAKFECPQAREKLAYEAQSRWLDMFGLDLEKELEIDPLALLISTQCLIWPP